MSARQSPPTASDTARSSTCPGPDRPARRLRRGPRQRLAKSYWPLLAKALLEGSRASRPHSIGRAFDAAITGVIAALGDLAASSGRSEGSLVAFSVRTRLPSSRPLPVPPGTEMPAPSSRCRPLSEFHRRRRNDGPQGWRSRWPHPVAWPDTWPRRRGRRDRRRTVRSGRMRHQSWRGP